MAAPGNDELEAEEGADTVTGGAGNDQFNFNAGSFQPDSVFAAQDVVTDFQGAGAAGGDVIRLSSGTFAFVGNLGINPQNGAPLPGANDGLTQLGYAQRSGNTYLIADSNDDGVAERQRLRGAGSRAPTTSPSTTSTTRTSSLPAPTAMTSSPAPKATTGSSRRAATTRCSRWAATMRCTGATAMTPSMAGPAVSTSCSAKPATTR